MRLKTEKCLLIERRYELLDYEGIDSRTQLPEES